jgi:dihydroorotase
MGIVLDRPVDMHLHLRQGEMLKDVIPWSSRQFAGGVVMPNLTPPVDSGEKVDKYREEIEEALNGEAFKPLMTLFMRNYTYRELKEWRSKIFSIKLYPAGITTNSEAGVKKLEEIYPVLEIMEELKIPLSVHGETNGFVMEREREFAPIYLKLAKDFPNLPIIMEHISTIELVDLLEKAPNLYATITLHHLLFTLDDVVGGKLNPHFFCKPILKTPKDREALQKVVKSGHPKVMFGSDSAPHPLGGKLRGSAGVFSAPVILPLLTLFFRGDVATFQKFVSSNARENFQLDLPDKKVKIVEEKWEVPLIVGEVIPLLAGKTLPFKVEGI